MKTVTIKYPGLIGERELSFSAPENWAELTPKQYLEVIRYMLGEISPDTIFFRLFPISKKLVSQFDGYYMYKLGELLSFLYDDRIEMDHFILPSLKISLIESYPAPAPKLADVSLQQFMSADTYFSYYSIKQEDHFLSLFVASLYKPADEKFAAISGNERLIYLPINASKLSALPRHQLFAVFLNWSFIKIWLGRIFPYMFPPSSPSAGPTGLPKPKGPDWLTLFDNFVGDHIADMQAYQAMPCMDAFRIINRKIKENSK